MIQTLLATFLFFTPLASGHVGVGSTYLAENLSQTFLTVTSKQPIKNLKKITKNSVTAEYQPGRTSVTTSKWEDVVKIKKNGVSKSFRGPNAVWFSAVGWENSLPACIGHAKNNTNLEPRVVTLEDISPRGLYLKFGLDGWGEENVLLMDTTTGEYFSKNKTIPKNAHQQISAEYCHAPFEESGLVEYSNAASSDQNIFMAFSHPIIYGDTTEIDSSGDIILSRKTVQKIRATNNCDQADLGWMKSPDLLCGVIRDGDTSIVFAVGKQPVHEGIVTIGSATFLLTDDQGYQLVGPVTPPHVYEKRYQEQSHRNDSNFSSYTHFDGIDDFIRVNQEVSGMITDLFKNKDPIDVVEPFTKMREFAEQLKSKN